MRKFSAAAALLGLLTSTALAQGITPGGGGGGGGAVSSVTGTGAVSCSPTTGAVSCLVSGGAVSNAMLTNSSVTINSHSLSLGGSLTLAFSDFSGTVAATQLPNPSATTLGGIESFAAQSNKWINTISTSGVPSATQPACGSLSDSTASCSTDATNASNISGGTLAAARGGAGTVNGALKGNGAGSVSQAACADLSNAGNGCSGTLPVAANPTATAGPTAVNGSASTFMRSDGSPAIQKATAAQFGIVEVDGTSITQSSGVISSSAGTCPTNFTQNASGCHWTQTASNSASLQWTGLTGSEYRLRCINAIIATSGQNLQFQLGEGGTPTWETANYSWASTYGFNNGTTGSGGTNGNGGNHSDSAVFLSNNATAAPGTSAAIYLSALSSTSANKAFTGTFSYGTNSTSGTVGGYYTGDTNAITAIRVNTTSGNITSGYCTLDWLSN